MMAARMNKGKANKKNILIACLTWYQKPTRLRSRIRLANVTPKHKP